MQIQREEFGSEVSHRMMTYGAHLCGETSVADVALERPLLGVRPDVDFQCRVAGKHFEANLAGGVAPGYIGIERVH